MVVAWALRAGSWERLTGTVRDRSLASGATLHESDDEAQEEEVLKGLSNENLRTLGAAGHWLLGLPPLVVFVTVVVLFLATVWSNWVIVKRAGHPGCLSLFAFVPCANVVFLLWFAFTRWPVQGAKKAR